MTYYRIYTWGATRYWLQILIVAGWAPLSLPEEWFIYSRQWIDFRFPSILLISDVKWVAAFQWECLLRYTGQRRVMPDNAMPPRVYWESLPTELQVDRVICLDLYKWLRNLVILFYVLVKIPCASHKGLAKSIMLEKEITCRNDLAHDFSVPAMPVFSSSRDMPQKGHPRILDTTIGFSCYAFGHTSFMPNTQRIKFTLKWGNAAVALRYLYVALF